MFMHSVKYINKKLPLIFSIFWTSIFKNDFHDHLHGFFSKILLSVTQFL